MNMLPQNGTWMHSRNLKRVLALTLPVIAVVSFFAIADPTPPSIPSVSLAPEPLYAKGTRDKPTLTLALSVEFPTVGAQYVNTPGATTDASYTQATTYLGYFDAESCYTYVDSPTAVTGYSTSALKRFDRSGAATSHGCGGTGFSGNFMNWATSSAIDVLRLGLTGGDRIVDTEDITVLQRAVLRNGGFYNDSNFPAKQLLSSLANDAVPSTLRGSHTGDIWVANCLNRVHFGTQSTGSCGSPGNNANLGTSTVTGTSITNYSGSLSGYSGTDCASENGTCSFTGTYAVAYGASTSWKIGVFTDGTPCTNGVFGDPIVGTAKKCYRATATSTPPTSTVGALTTDNFFYTRVKVCETNSSGVLQDTRKYNSEDFCLKYPSGKYKPAGNLQKYSDRLRVSAFGYLMDDTLNRYGGVLRAPMKYVGPKTYDINGSLVTGTNPKIEWNETTGVFIANPDSASDGKSGVVNYLNQFGRTGTTPGTYKTYDPVGELYYEALRYIQGLDPTPQATSGITAGMKDGFPVYDKGSSGETLAWTDPHAGGSNAKDYSCLKNNIVVVGDVNTHADKSVPGNTLTTNSDFTRTASLANNEPDFRAWTNVVGRFEQKGSQTYLDGTTAAGVSRNTNATNTNTANSNSNYSDLQNAEPGCCNNNSYLMAGVAYWANTHDVRGTNWTANTAAQRPGMRVTTYVLDVNEYGNQTNLTTRRNNQFYLAAKYGGFKDISGGKGNPFLNASGGTDNSGWETASGSNLASKYFLSSSAADVLKSLRDIFENIAQEGNSIAGGAISTQRLTSVGGYIYQAQFDAADWSGDLVSYPVSVDSSNVVTIADGTTVPAQWSAGAKLNAKIAADTTASTRKIYIGKATPDSIGNASEFKTLSNLESSLQTALSKSTPSATADGNAQLRINYLRGDRSLETSTFRKRGSLLGDIINSGVAFSGAPSTRISASDYGAFYTTNKDRKKVLYVGANDGMLHALNSADGEELFAYIPSWLGPKLPALTNATYNTGNHQSFMDGSPVVGEAKVGGVNDADSSSAWKSVLVSGTGGGGQGVFALDITDPDAFDASKVMWEFTERDDPDMGNIVGRPQLLKFRISGSGATAAYKWFAVVPSGVNNYVNDGNFSTTGRPALFLLDLGKPNNTAWTLGTNYYKISFPFNSTVGATKATGLANFKVTGGPSDEVALLYAGDLHGNMWKLDFTLSTGFAEWNSATYAADFAIDKLSPFKSTASPFHAIPLFIAKDGSGNVQPITMEPTLVRGPAGGVILGFGTGKYMESTDNVVNSSTQIQSVYSIFDTNSATADASSPTAIISGKGRLQAGSLNSSGVLTTSSFKWGRPTSDGDSTQRSGWYYNFASGGERQISGFAVFGNQIVFGSVIPPDAVVDACGSGTGYQYKANIATGNGIREVSQVGLLGEPFVLEVGSANVSISDSTGRRQKTTTGQIILQGSTGLKAISSQPTDTSLVGRLSWRQINNYQDLRNAP
jgi:type IV pilus assembly protein PilY1